MPFFLQETYLSQIKASRVTVLELIKKFPSIELSIEVIPEVFQKISYRFYSIASCPLVFWLH